MHEMMEMNLKDQVLIGVFREKCALPFQVP